MVEWESASDDLPGHHTTMEVVFDESARSSDQSLLVETRGSVATVTLNRPSRLNAITPEVVTLLRQQLEILSADSEVRVVVLTGAGRAFCAGGDVANMADMHVEDVTFEFVRELVTLSEVLYNLRPVTIAAINGACAGGGLALACAADLRCAADSAVFVAAFLEIGTTGDMGLPWHLARLVGLGKAKELSLLGSRVGSADALAIGLVNRVVPDAELSSTVAELADRIADMAPLATVGMKENLNDALEVDLPEFLERESARYAANAVTQDSSEAILAFTEHRRPIYRGR
jgi:2-(1,2-epoxy-1,2-dihydrophenyl)acetyl-CoA isomerase